MFVDTVSGVPSTELHKSRLEALLARAWQTLSRDPEGASGPAHEAEHLARRLGDNRSWAQSLLIWGISVLYAGQAREAITLLSRALAVYRFTGDEEGQWGCLVAIAKAWHYLGDPEQASETQAVADRFTHRERFEAGAAWLSWFRGF